MGQLSGIAKIMFAVAGATVGLLVATPYHIKLSTQRHHTREFYFLETLPFMVRHNNTLLQFYINRNRSYLPMGDLGFTINKPNH